MALPTWNGSGPAISMSMVNTELGRASNFANSNLNESAIRTLFAKPSGAISMYDGFGKSAGPPITTANPVWMPSASSSSGGWGLNFLGNGTVTDYGYGGPVAYVSPYPVAEIGFNYEARLYFDTQGQGGTGDHFYVQYGSPVVQDEYRSSGYTSWYNLRYGAYFSIGNSSTIVGTAYVRNTTTLNTISISYTWLYSE